MNEYKILLLGCFFFFGFFQQDSILKQLHSFKLEKRISDDPSSSFIFSSPGNILVDSDKIFVLDIGEKNIKVFNSKLNYIKTFGREGKGPGEFIMPMQIVFDERKNIVVWDQSNCRFTSFAQDGKYLSAHNYTPAVKEFHISNKGDYYICTKDLRPKNASDLYTVYKLIKMSADFKSEYILDSSLILTNHIVKEKSLVMIPIPYRNDYCWGMNKDDIIFIAESRTNKIKILVNDKMQRNVEFSGYKKSKVYEKDKLNFLQSLGFSDGTSVSRTISPAIRKALKFPDYKENFSRIISVGREFAFLRFNSDKETEYYLFSPSGKFLENMKLPGEISYPAVIYKNYVFSIQEENGKYYLAKYSFSN